MARDRVLVDATWVESHLQDPGVVVVEVDEDVSAYDVDHLPGAVRLDWTTELQQPDVRDVIDRPAFEALLSRKGIATSDLVVLYGGNNNWFAAYAYWYFRLYGHENVRLLDGGRKKWQLDGLPMTSERTHRLSTEYRAQEPDSSLRAFRDDVLTGIGSLNLVDVRSPEEYTGRISAPAHLPQEQAQRRGHVPTAINVPWSRTANEDGTFAADDELRALYTDAGLDWTKPTVVYCRIGERSSHSWLVLSELLDMSSVRNYDGSWVEYGSLIGAPISNPSAGLTS